MATEPCRHAYRQRSPAKEPIHLALVGAGAQGKALLGACIRLGKSAEVRIQAVCDIWPRNRLYVCEILGRLARQGHAARPYADYRQMLQAEGDLDAVLIATPDFCHAEQTIACLEKGLHVYCEPEMSTTIQGACAMVQAARRTGRLLQVGRQRRSNPQYRDSCDVLLGQHSILNRLTAVRGQCHLSQQACAPRGWPLGSEIPDQVLAEHGYQSMYELCNWRFVRRLGGGHFVEAASHQLDVFRWFLGGGPPVSVLACGTYGYWPGSDVPDGVVAVLEFATPAGMVRAVYELLTTNSSLGSFEQFMGDEGTLVLSESSGRNAAYREGWIQDTEVTRPQWAKWERWTRLGVLVDVEGHHRPLARTVFWPHREELHRQPETGVVADVRESPVPPRYALPSMVRYPAHAAHLKNFFDAIRGRAQLTCPGQEALVTTVMTLETLHAVSLERRLGFVAGDFGAAHDQTPIFLHPADSGRAELATGGR